jgi:hypothetical protein
LSKTTIVILFGINPWFMFPFLSLPALPLISLVAAISTAVSSEQATTSLNQLASSQALFSCNIRWRTILSSPGNEAFHPALEDTPFQKDTVLAFEAFNPDVQP